MQGIEKDEAAKLGDLPPSRDPLRSNSREILYWGRTLLCQFKQIDNLPSLEFFWKKTYLVNFFDIFIIILVYYSWFKQCLTTNEKHITHELSFAGFRSDSNHEDSGAPSATKYGFNDLITHLYCWSMVRWYLRDTLVSWARTIVWLSKYMFRIKFHAFAGCCCWYLLEKHALRNDQLVGIGHS